MDISVCPYLSCVACLSPKLHWIWSIVLGYFNQNWFKKNSGHLQWFLLEQRLGWNNKLRHMVLIVKRYIKIKKSATRRCFKYIYRSTSQLNLQWTEETHLCLIIITEHAPENSFILSFQLIHNKFIHTFTTVFLDI